MNIQEFLQKIRIQEELNFIQTHITPEDIQTFSTFGKKVTRYRDLYEKYWHLTSDYERIKEYRGCEFYSAHTEKNNLINAGISGPVLENFKSIHEKIISEVKEVAETMYPSYVTSFWDPKRTRLPIHTHNTHKFVENKSDSLLTLSFAIRMTDFDLASDETRLRFYKPQSDRIMRLEEETRQDIDQFEQEFKPGNFSFYVFDTESAPHTALFGKNLYCWFVFDYAQFKFEFDHGKYLRGRESLAVDIF